MVKPHRAPRNSGGAKPFSPITKSDSDSSGLLKKLGASKANDVRKSVKPSNRSLRIDSDDEVTDGNDAKLQQAPSCDEGLDTIEVQIVQKKWDLDNLSIETTKLQKLKKALQASVMRQKQRRLVAIAGVLQLAKRGGGV